MRKRIRLFLLIAFLPIASWAEIHKCIVNGKTVFTDEKCADSTSVAFELKDLNVTPATEVSYKGSIWLSDKGGYAMAAEAGVIENAPVLIYGYTDWCGYCRKLEELYFGDYRIDNVLSQFVKVKINPEHSAEDKKLFNSMGGTGYPTLFVKYPNQAPTKIRIPSFKSGEASRPATMESFIKMLQGHLKPFEKTAPAK